MTPGGHDSGLYGIYKKAQLMCRIEIGLVYFQINSGCHLLLLIEEDYSQGFKTGE
jgi:hypothetical protein